MSGKRRRDVLSRSLKDTVMSFARKTDRRPDEKAPEGPTWTAADFASLPVYQGLKTQRGASELFGVENPFFKAHDGRAGALTRIGGRQLVNFASYDYLGLNGHPDIAKAVAHAIAIFGTSASASRVVAGERSIHRDLEARIAALYGVEDAVVFVSGHATNVATISALLGANDLVITDALAHNSMFVGAQLSGAARRSFAHNDLDNLERVLTETRARHNHVLIAVEGLYSMDGDVPDLPRLIELKNRFGAWLMVDEAHALGTLGRRGRGSAEHFGVDGNAVDIWMGTLSKTCASCGGFIAGSKALVEILKCTAAGFVYSVGMSPPNAAAALAAIEIMQREPERVARLQSNSRLFLDLARGSGLDTGFAEGHAVIGVMIGDSLRAVKLTQSLFERGINTLPIIHPAVPVQAARLRFFLSSEHTETQIRMAIAATKEELLRLEGENFGLSKLATSVIGRNRAEP